MNDEIDNWQPIDGFPGYSVNPLGQVRRDSSGRLITPRFNQYGVPYVGLMRGWAQCTRSLPKLVAHTFLPRTNSIFDTPIQIDGDRSNCRADNLMWRPRWYAVLYNRQFDGDRYDHPIDAPIRMISDDGVETETFPDSLTAACRFGLLEREVVLSVLNRTPAWPTYQYFELLEME
jgi:hypothetical protein